MRKSQQHKRKQHRTNCDPTTHCAPPPTPPTLPKYLSLQRVATIKFNSGLPLARRNRGPAPTFLLPCGSRVHPRHKASKSRYFLSADFLPSLPFVPASLLFILSFRAKRGI